MKLILIGNVQGLGGIGEEKEVKDGYARNYLIPKGLAVKLGDPKAKQIIKKITLEKKKKEKIIEESKKIASEFDGKTIIIRAKVGPTGKLFGSISMEEIAKKISTKEVKIESKQIEVEPIKNLGEHNLTVNFGNGIKSIIILVVEEEKKRKEQ